LFFFVPLDSLILLSNPSFTMLTSRLQT
jgi:hypothetical protein